MTSPVRRALVRPQAVLFDWGGTLTPWHDIDLLEAWRVYAAAAGHPDPDEVADRLLAAEDAAWRVVRDDHRSSTLERILHAAGVDPAGPEHDRGMAAYQAWWEPHTWTDPDAAALLTALRELGLRTGVLSNTMWTQAYHRHVLARDGVEHLLDGAVFSSDLPVTKPHPEAFGAAMRAVGVTDPGACVYVGDRLFDDVHGAQAAGMRAVHVPHSAIPDSQRGHTEGVPDAVVHRLGDVLEVVRGWL